MMVLLQKKEKSYPLLENLLWLKWENIEQNIKNFGPIYVEKKDFHDHYTLGYYRINGLPDGKEDLINYLLSYSDLKHAMYVNAMGNGFIIGILAAMYNKKSKSKDLIDPNLLWTVPLASILTILYQNCLHNKAPYYETNFGFIGNRSSYDKYDNLFSAGGMNCKRILIMMCSAMLSGYGTSYAIDKLNELKQYLSAKYYGNKPEAKGTAHDNKI